MISISTSITLGRRLTRRQVICFQELFYGPYFCQSRRDLLRLREFVPEGRPTQAHALRLSEQGHILPVYEMEQEGSSTKPRGHRRRTNVLGNTARRTSPGERSSGRSSTSSGTRLPIFDTRGGLASHLLRPTLSRRWAALASPGQDRLQSSRPVAAVGLPLATGAARLSRRDEYFVGCHQPRRVEERARTTLRPELLVNRATVVETCEHVR